VNSIKKTIIVTKLQHPQIKKNTLRRSRLLKSLKEKLDRKLILINAGAGYGKTTLLSQFLSEIKIPYVFYHLEKTDGEMNVFFSYLTAGIKRRYAQFGKRTENILQKLKYPNKYLDIVAGTFINEIVEWIPNDLLIILDDYHNIDPSTYIDQTLNYLFKHAPPSLHFIISTRQTPLFYLSKMKARQEFFKLSSNDLRFTNAEIKKLLEDIYSIPLNEHELKILQKYCEGWITSLQLMLQSSADNIKDTFDKHYTLADMKTRHELQSDYFNYFAQEIYNREAKDVQQFIVDCSILEWLDPDICYAVTGRRDSKNILYDLEAQNAFLNRVSDNSYRFHNLYRDFLFSKLPVSRRKQMYLMVARYLFKSGQTEFAANYYLLAGQYNQVVAIMSKIGYNLTDRGKSDTVCSYIEKLPQSIVNHNPDVLMIYGYALMLSGYPHEATDNLMNAIKLFQKKSKSSTKLARAFYELASVNFIGGNDQLAMKWLRKALQACPKKKDITYAYILNSLGILYSRLGIKKYADAVESFKQALHIVKNYIKDESTEAVIYNNWAMIERKMGNLRTAYEKSSDAICLLKKEGNFCAQSGTAFCSAAWFSLQLGYLQQAYSVLTVGLDISKKYNDIYSQATLWRGFSWYFIESEDFQKAKEYLQKSIEFFHAKQFRTSLQTANRDLCLINIELGLLAEAEQNLSASWDIKKTRDDADAIELLSVEAELRRAQGKLDSAKKTLCYALRLAKKYGQMFETFTILLRLADVLHESGKIVQAEEFLQQAVTLACERDYGYRFAQVLRKKRWMIECVMKSEKKYVLSILSRARIPYHIVEISLFGNPTIHVDGKEIRPESWKTAKAMKLFCYLCTKRRKPVSRDELIDTLWPNASLRSGSINLRKAMQHIRQAFNETIRSDDNPLQYRGKFYTISPYFSVLQDTEEFMHTIDTITQSKQFTEKQRDDVIKAVALYEIELAKGWYDDWVEEMRSYYNKLYEKCLLILVDHYLEKNNCRESIVWLNKLITKNYYEEEYHKKLWTIYARLKKFNAIKQDFVALEKAFKKEMKAQLHPETIALYKSFIK